MVSIEQVEECRWYENEFPNENDIVMCKIVETNDEGSYVELLEYNNIRGMILKSLISKKRIKNLKQVMKEGNEEILRVVRVDKVQGYIDLSKKDLNTDETKDFQLTFSKSKQVDTIMKSIAMKLGEKSLESLYKLFGWRFYKDYEHAYEAFKLISV
jgi:translation initiation factor 2 subunit 1